MSNGLTYIKSKDKCIYCGKLDTKLSDEHIVPESLGGVHIIRKASCPECATITSRFEMHQLNILKKEKRLSPLIFLKVLKKLKFQPLNIQLVLFFTEWVYQVYYKSCQKIEISLPRGQWM
jgi:hypothetical protein